MKYPPLDHIFKIEAHLILLAPKVHQQVQQSGLVLDPPKVHQDALDDQLLGGVVIFLVGEVEDHDAVKLSDLSILRKYQFQKGPHQDPIPVNEFVGFSDASDLPDALFVDEDHQDVEDCLDLLLKSDLVRLLCQIDCHSPELEHELLREG